MHGPINLSCKYIAMINQYIFYQLFSFDLIPLNLLLRKTSKKGDLFSGVST